MEHLLEINVSGVAASHTQSHFYKHGKLCKQMIFFPAYEDSLEGNDDVSSSNGASSKRQDA